MASAKPLFYALPWLMILLIGGTIAQKEMGLYAAQDMFFSAWVIWVGPFPLPGTYTTLAFITAALLVKFLLYSPWNKKQAGNIVTHLGILVLMIGGLLTAISQQEGFMPLPEGGTTNQFFDYHDRVISVQKNDKDYLTLSFSKMKKDSVIALPFTVKVERLCQNCRPAPVTKTTGRKGLAAQMDLREAPPEKENEANLSGITMRIAGAEEPENGLYVMMEEIPHKPTIHFGGDSYVFSIGRAQTALPFSIELVDFKRDIHPGTDIARGFSSDVIVHDDGVDWPTTIQMNEPLRYKGYTFYQSSFAIRPDGETSILSVVHNKGRVFPYLASAIIFMGLFIHILLRLFNARRSI